jgi:phospholipid/cholesterol/gamma-HCH transport system permease protein
MQLLARIGNSVITQLRKTCYLVAVVSGVITATFKFRHWPRTTRVVLARQILFTGFDAQRFVAMVGCTISVSIIVQLQLWLAKLGQTTLLAPILVTVVLRELAPLLTNFVVIGRSGNAITTELGQMSVAGEVRALDAQGLDPFTYLVLPRVIGMAVSVFCLTVIFATATLVSAYLLGFLLGQRVGTVGEYFQNIVQEIQFKDVISILMKTVLPALCTGSICCIEGLSVERTISDVPRATTRAVQRSVIWLFVISAAAELVSFI